MVKILPIGFYTYRLYLVAFCAIKPSWAGGEYAEKITTFPDTMKNIKARFKGVHP